MLNLLNPVQKLGIIEAVPVLQFTGASPTKHLGSPGLVPPRLPQLPDLMLFTYTLLVPRIARRSNGSILKEITPDSSLAGQILKLKLRSFGQPNEKGGLIGKDPDVEEDGRQKETGMAKGEMVR